MSLACLRALLLGATTVLAALSGNPVPTGCSDGLIIMMGIAMGLQKATARKLAVPDLTTTVLTLAIVGAGADNRLAGGSGSKSGRRLTAVAAMFVGALVGSVLIIHVFIVSPLVITLVVMAAVSFRAGILSGSVRSRQEARGAASALQFSATPDVGFAVRASVSSASAPRGST